LFIGLMTTAAPTAFHAATSEMANAGLFCTYIPSLSPAVNPLSARASASEPERASRSAMVSTPPKYLIATLSGARVTDALKRPSMVEHDSRC
jgi:hypothetical protein